VSLEKPNLRLGVMRLTDCAPLVIAKERGFFAAEDLSVELSLEASWANIRDKVVAGILDGAQMLAAMPVAATLGLGGISRPTIAPLSLDLNGNAVTVSNTLYGLLENADLSQGSRPIRMAMALARLVDEGKRSGRAPFTFATVFPFSTHNYELRYWFASAGINPDEDLNLVTIPPPQMVAQLEAGKIDGFCVGEPWNTLAVQRGIGTVAVANYSIWNNAPEKVFAVNADWAAANPRTLQALLRALIQAGRWIDQPENRVETVHVIAGESHIGVPTEAIASSMTGQFQTRVGGEILSVPDFNVFFRYGAGFPWLSHAEWVVTQMYRWGQINAPLDIRRIAENVYRPDLYREAASSLGISVPACSRKTEGTHDTVWKLDGTLGPIEMGPDLFMDGKTFDPDRLVDYLRGQTVKNLRISLDALAQYNR